ncbi:8-amino-7-oxononanoate synthase [Legionella beliardensis]|uniref:8-amino-7-oxononanoate synthase n=1 Tax=Legionella beliardensis TaxID=91822 RepID=A0A378I143_9GAMM|nr:pyridoxal phosphate-dependent aminotransferase family protein [Legionella beliardensis]STX28927.1 8-amino-7-oxononanoate synthase [Legionella beliardensis]
MITDLLRQQKSLLLQQGLYRTRPIIDEYGPHVLNFSSNDYLSLRHDEQVRRAYAQGFCKHSSGSGASMSVGGYHKIHQELERTFAHYLKADSALLFSSGYAANLGIVSLLAQLNCHVLIDKAVHASIYDGIKLNNIKYTRFLHNNYEDLEGKLSNSIINPAVITEAIFSMSGQQSNLAILAKLCATGQIPILVDEAHSFGVVGPHGLGAVAYYQLPQHQVPLRLITFSKSLGGQGAIIVGQGEWVEALFQQARSNIYSTAVSPALSYGLLKSLDIVMKSDDRRSKLAELIAYFQQKIQKSPLKWRHSHTPIQQLQLGCPHKALDYALQLKKYGIICQAMREPTVCRTATGLRVVLNAQHEPQDIDHLFDRLQQIDDTQSQPNR